MSDPYLEFIERKTQLGSSDGFEPYSIPSQAFDFQAKLIDWAVRKGRCALFEDCGLGKTLQELAWAQNVVRQEYRDWTGKQTENRFSHWIWRQYASAFWDDIRIDRVLPHREARDEEDERHVHPLQLDVIERCVVLRSNPGEIVLDPFAGVGSTPYGAVGLGRRAIGVELKPSYYRQAVANMEMAGSIEADQGDLLAVVANE